jgi:hypothetical protein
LLTFSISILKKAGLDWVYEITPQSALQCGLKKNVCKVSQREEMGLMKY